MTTPTTLKTTFTVLAELVVRVPRVPPLPSSQLTVCLRRIRVSYMMLTFVPSDSKQARDLVTILSEAKQQIDPRLAEMVRYSGGGGHGGGYGRWGGRGGRGGGRGRGGNFTASNAAPLGNSRRW